MKNLLRFLRHFCTKQVFFLHQVQSMSKFEIFCFNFFFELDLYKKYIWRHKKIRNVIFLQIQIF